MAMKGNVKSVRQFEAQLRKVGSVQTAERIAKIGAQVLTEKLDASFDSGNTVYNDSRPDGFHGAVDLVKTGTIRSHLRFRSVGRLIRCVLGTKYAKYMIGRFRILPNGGTAMPFEWSEALAEISKRVIADTLAGRA